MMKVRDLSRDQRTEIVEYRNSGERMADIAHRVGCKEVMCREPSPGVNRGGRTRTCPDRDVRASLFVPTTSTCTWQLECHQNQQPGCSRSSSIQNFTGESADRNSRTGHKIVVFDRITRICIIVLRCHELIFISFCLLYVVWEVI